MTDQTREAQFVFDREMLAEIIATVEAHPSGKFSARQKVELLAALSEAEERATRAEAERDTALARIAELEGQMLDQKAWEMVAPALYATPSAALARAEVPEGWKLVPETPTPEMCWAWANGLNPLETWSKMLAAAPAPTVKGEGE